MRDRLWFFTSGRMRDESQGRTLIGTNVPYVYTEEQRRYEVKGTYSLTPSHRFQMNYNRHDRSQINYSFNQEPDDGLARVSVRENCRNVCGRRELQRHALVQVVRRGAGVETELGLHRLGREVNRLDRRDTPHRQQPGRWRPLVVRHVLRRLHARSSRQRRRLRERHLLLVPRPNFGSHNFVFGYDNFDDIRQANNHQSGSDYRILERGGDPQRQRRRRERSLPIFLGDGTTTIQWNPITQGERGHQLPDALRVPQRQTGEWAAGSRRTWASGSTRITARIQSGNVVAKDSAWSPRLGLIWDPTGKGQWSVTGSVANDVAAISNPVADCQLLAATRRLGSSSIAATASTAPARRPRRRPPRRFAPCSTGSSPMAVPPCRSTALRRFLRHASDCGRSSSPSAWEYASGVARQFGGRGSLRADLLIRHYVDFTCVRPIRRPATWRIRQAVNSICRS